MNKGDFLSVKRREKGLSFSDVAQKLGVSEEEVVQWEFGELPDSEHLLGLAALLDVSVEDILRGGEQRNGATADDAKDAVPEPAESSPHLGADKSPAEAEPPVPETAASSPRLDAEEAPDETVPPTPEMPESESSAPETPDPQESCYETVQRELYGNPESETYLAGTCGSNGYSFGERIFGYLLFAVFVVIMAVSLIGRPRELTLDNYDDFIDVNVVSTENFNPDEYIVRITAKKKISEFRITVQVKFQYFFIDGEVEESVSMSGDLAKNGTLERTIRLSDPAWESGFQVLSVKGRIA